MGVIAGALQHGRRGHAEGGRTRLPSRWDDHQEREHDGACVQAAKRGLDMMHNLRSEIETLHIDAVVEWHQVVDAARRSDVIFNCIDYGT